MNPFANLVPRSRKLATKAQTLEPKTPELEPKTPEPENNSSAEPALAAATPAKPRKSKRNSSKSTEKLEHKPETAETAETKPTHQTPEIASHDSVALTAQTDPASAETPLAVSGAATEKPKRSKKQVSSVQVEFWTAVLDQTAVECSNVFTLRTGGVSQAHWFAQWQDPQRKKKVLWSVVGLKPPQLEFLSRLPFLAPTAMDPVSQTAVAIRLLARLLDVQRPAYGDLRAWISRGQDAAGWCAGTASLSRTDLDVGAVNLDHLLWIFDSFYGFSTHFCRVPGASIAQVTRAFDKKLAWDLSPVRNWMHTAYLSQLHPVALLSALWARDREFCAKRGYIATVRLDNLIRCFPMISPEDLQRIPKLGQQHLVDWQYAFGLPGDVHLPERIPFGLDFSKAFASSLRPISVTEGGQVVYRDLNGKIHSEGHPLPNKASELWGSRALVVWMTRDNYRELLPHWYAPPVRCPWSWYSRYGNGIYREDGTAIHPDSKLRPTVRWLEQEPLNG